MCWLTSFPGAAWFSESDQTGGVVVCKPLDEVSEIGRFTFYLYRAWKLLQGLPIPLP